MRRSRPVPAKPLTSFVEQSQPLAAIRAEVRRLEALRAGLAAALPAYLAASSLVGSCRDGTVSVVADNPAAAAKLRQLAPRLVKKLRETGAEVTQLQVRVQPDPGLRAGLPADCVTRSLSAVSARSIALSSSIISDQRIKTALIRLSSRINSGSET
jgi:hypothetical protein